MTRIHVLVGASLCITALWGCADSTELDLDGSAVVEGRVEETAPQASGQAAATSPQRAPGAGAQSVAVVQVQADGSVLELATADVRADGSYTVSTVPAGREDLAVVAYVDGAAAGRVMIHERSQAGAVLIAAPITYETTVEGRSYSRLRASGMTDASVGAELELLVHVDGQAAETVATSETEVGAVAAAYFAAQATLTEIYAAEGIALDARTRAEIMTDAAVEYAASRHAGVSVEMAHEAFSDAAIDLLVDAGADLEATVVATAAAATTFDAALEGASSVRGRLAVQPARLNVAARERLAASFSSSAEGSVAVAVRQALAQGYLSLLVSQTLVDLQAALESLVSASADAAVDASVELLAADASAAVRTEVRARAEEAVEAARLHARLAAATTTQAAVQAANGYRAAVRAAVEAMVAAAGATSADVDVLVALYVAACGGAHVG